MYYIIMESGEEYNDEVNHLVDGGEPIRVFFDREKAEAEVIQLYRKKLSGFRPWEYLYSLKDFDKGFDVHKFLKIEDIDDFDMWDGKFPDDISEEQAIHFMEKSGLKFYYIKQIQKS